MTDDQPEWMEPIDDEILEAFRDEDVFTPQHVGDAGILRGPDAGYRCRELAKHGLLEKHMTGVYDLSDLGRRYLEGEVEEGELE